MAKFKDVHVAGRMRDIMRKIALDQINRVLPADEFGSVVSVDVVSRHATVQMPDGSLPITVSYGFGVAPNPGDSVRITGRSGSRYIVGLGVNAGGTTDISTLPVGAPLSGGEILEVIQLGVPVQTSTGLIADIAGVYVDYVPVVTQSAIPVITINRARYGLVGKRCYGDAWVTIASGAGTGGFAVAISLPLPPAVETTAQAILGHGFVFDASSSIAYPGHLMPNVGTSSAQFLRLVETTALNYLGVAGFTAALAVGDVIAIHFDYEVP